VQAVAAQLSSKLTLLPPSTLVAVLAAFVRLGAPPDPSWVLTAAAALDGRLAGLCAFELQQLLALLVSLNAVVPEGWLDRAGRTAQQLLQGSGSMGVEAQAEVAAAAGQQLESCQQLISRLRELRRQQQQQQQEGPDGDAGILGGTTLDISGDTVEVEVAG
jgi:hypothetical protein